MRLLNYIILYKRTYVWYNIFMNKAIKYRIYPNKDQTDFFNKCFGCCRFVYNQALNWRILAYNADNTSLNYNDTAYGLTTIKKYYPWLKEADSIALQQALRHLDAAFKNFFSDTRSGFPKFKSKKNGCSSYSTINQNGTVYLLDNAIKLPKVGVVKAKIHRQPTTGWMLKSATVSKECDGRFYVSVLFEYAQNTRTISSPQSIIGLDYKSDGLYMDSNGNAGPQHKYFRKNQKKLAKAQRKLKSKAIGSNNYKKQQLKINRIHKHIANQRLDNLHKLSTEIANRYDVVCVENLNMRSMSNRCFGNGKATMDNGYGMFLNMLEYKLADRGKYFIKVDKWYPSSQLCSCCGKKMKLTLSQRIYRCSCGLILDRDLNAAINIRNEGLRLLRSA